LAQTSLRKRGGSEEDGDNAKIEEQVVVTMAVSGREIRHKEKVEEKDRGGNGSDVSDGCGGRF
jgi:hypothetical protein